MYEIGDEVGKLVKSDEGFTSVIWRKDHIGWVPVEFSYRDYGIVQDGIDNVSDGPEVLDSQGGFCSCS